MIALLRLTLVFTILCGGSSTYADDPPQRFTATAIYFNDGDTGSVRIEDGRQYKIRLFGIDAPESDQPNGTAARDALRALIGDREFEVRLTGAETYGRYVARLYLDGVYVNRELVEDGWAWHYDDYTAGNERRRFANAERNARDERVGLWADSNPIRPECWRRGDRTGDCRPDLAPLALRDGVAPTSAPAMSRTDVASTATAVSTSAPRRSPVDRFMEFRATAVDRLPRMSTARATAATTRTGSAGHTIYGQPVAADDRFRFTPSGHNEEVDGITKLTRTAFTVGHYDRYRLPAWVAMRWTKQDYERGEGVSMNRPGASTDVELPVYARGGTSFEYARTGLQRGHMAPDDLMESWGRTAVGEAVRMSNMVPQLEGRNHAVWTLLEIAVKEVVANDEDEIEIDSVWTVAGPVFDPDVDEQRVGQPGTRVPDATYKIIGWANSEGRFMARAYVIGQLDDNTDLWRYLKTIDEVESQTGLDFFPDLDDEEEDELESTRFSTLWE